MEPLGVPVVDWVLSLMEAWGYVITFLGSTLESVAFVGAVIPGDVIVITASFVASKGHLSIFLVGFASFLGTILGNNLTFLFFRRRGRDAILAFARKMEKTRIGRLLKISDESLIGAERYFEIHGAKTVFVARFATGIKGYVIAIAGTCRMSLFWFELYTAISALAYAILMCVIGWFVGENLETALAIVARVGYVGLGMFLLLILSVVFGSRFALLRRRSTKLESLAEEVLDDEDHLSGGSCPL